MTKINQLLLIEDNDITILITRKMIQKTANVSQIKVEKNGRDGFEYLLRCVKDKQPLPDVILLDIMMPVWDGWDFLRKIEELGWLKKLNIYLYTSSESHEDRNLARRYGLEDRYLVKPMGREIMGGIMRELKKETSKKQIHLSAN
ncbi:MAG: response regulator [Balneolia bacterium]|nr:response regulator [Balneolia bacterium]